MRTNAFRWLALLGLVVLATGSLAREARGTGFTVQENVQYCLGAGEPLYLDIAQPTGEVGPYPGIIFIHGGGWHSGDKREFALQIQRAASEGYIAITVNYRLAPAYPFPAAVEDVKCAVRWLRAHAGELALDPGKIGAWGSSAGANLAAMLAVTPPSAGLEGTGGYAGYSSAVEALVDWWGPIDLIALWSETTLKSRGSLTDYLGGAPTASPAIYSNYLRASPSSYVSAQPSPTLILQGDQDQIVPLDQSELFARQLASAGGSATLIVFPGAGHGLIVDGNPFSRESLLYRVEADMYSFAFFDRLWPR